MGSQQLTKSSINIFQVTPANLPVGANSYSLPTLSVDVSGIPFKPAPFLIDFSNDYSVVWGKSCINAVTGKACSTSPTDLLTSYVNSTAAIGTFNNMMFGGYNVSGNIYYDELILQTSGIARIIPLYEANTVYQDLWQYGVSSATYGILGFGPLSSLWSAYVNPNTATATYAIALSPTTTSSNAVAASITIGATLQPSYIG